MIVDTSALVAILFQEPEREHLLEAAANGGRLKVSAVGVVELTMVLSREFDDAANTECDRFLKDFGITVEPVTHGQARLASEAFLRFGKGRHPAALNFGDCFSYALAKATGEALLCKGIDFVRTDIRIAG